MKLPTSKETESQRRSRIAGNGVLDWFNNAKMQKTRPIDVSYFAQMPNENITPNTDVGILLYYMDILNGTRARVRYLRAELEALEPGLYQRINETLDSVENQIKALSKPNEPIREI